MVMIAPVVAAAIEACREPRGGPRMDVLMGPEGDRLDHARAAALAGGTRLLLVCGRYEGIDERVRAARPLRRGDLAGGLRPSGGEAAALALTEAISRLIPGVVGATESLENESFQADRLDYPHYTRPREFRGLVGARGAPLRGPPRIEAGGERRRWPGPGKRARICSTQAPRGAGRGRGMS